MLVDENALAGGDVCVGRIGEQGGFEIRGAFLEATDGYGAFENVILQQRDRLVLVLWIPDIIEGCVGDVLYGLVGGDSNLCHDEPWCLLELAEQ